MSTIGTFRIHTGAALALGILVVGAVGCGNDDHVQVPQDRLGRVVSHTLAPTPATGNPCPVSADSAERWAASPDLAPACLRMRMHDWRTVPNPHEVQPAHVK